MSSRVPLQPMSSALPRRKPRICTREACETCREKKAKCDGEQPCSRCEARGLECKYQIRNHRTKRSLRNELNALKEKQRLQEVLLGALQDPDRREAALGLLDSEDPLMAAAKLWLKDDELDMDRERALSAIPSKFSDDGHRSTSESASPFPDPSVPHRSQDDHAAASASGSKVSSARRDSVPRNMHSTDRFAMPMDTETRGGHHQMNPLMGPGGNNQRFPQFPQSFPAAPGTSGMSSGNAQFGNGQLDGSDHMFAPSWLDPSLGPSFAQQDKNLPFMSMRQGNVQQPWMGSSGNPMMQQAPLDFDNTQFKQWGGSPQVDERKLPITTSPPPPNSASTTMSFNFDTSMPSNIGQTTRFTSPPANPAQGPRISRRDSNRRTSAPSASYGNDQPQQRSDSRERHRLASARNWHKQKQATADLQATKERVEAQHAALRNEYNDVLSQVQQVKLALLGHAGCNDPAIKMWLEREANGVVTGLQNPLSDGGMDAQDLSSMADIGDNPYPTPEDDLVPGQKRSRAEAGDMMMGGVEVNVKA